MKKHATIAGIILTLALGGLKFISRKAEGYARATAETAAERVEDAIPAAIQDKKVDNEVRSVRQEIIDRQVQMNLSSRQISQLTDEVSRLEHSVTSRKRLLADAYPVLDSALKGQQTTVKFANQDYALADFQREIDDLLVMQDRETRQLEIKTKGLAHLKKSAEDGQAALNEMKHSLDSTEQEVAMLRSRREQANTEALTLDLVSSATAKSESVGAELGESLARLKTTVDQVEAHNEARRGIAGPEQRPSSRTIDRHWSRLESLKAIHESNQPAAQAQPAPEPSQPEAAVPTTIDASKVTITVEGTPAAQ